MPHIAVSMYPGRNDGIKKALAEKLQTAIIEELGVSEDVVSVSIADVKPEDWDDAMKSIPQKDMFIRAGK